MWLLNICFVLLNRPGIFIEIVFQVCLFSIFQIYLETCMHIMCVRHCFFMFVSQKHAIG